MKKLSYILFLAIAVFTLSSCGEKSTKKRSLDDTLFKYASTIRWADFDNALRFLKPTDKKTKMNGLSLRRLKQFKVSGYAESPITPGASENVIHQDVQIQIYNIHTNQTQTIFDRQTWEFNAEQKQWYLTTGLPKL